MTIYDHMIGCIYVYMIVIVPSNQMIVYVYNMIYIYILYVYVQNGAPNVRERVQLVHITPISRLDL